MPLRSISPSTCDSTDVNVTPRAAAMLPIPAVMHEASPSPLIDRHVVEGDTLALGDHVGRVIHTPGHSPGSCALYFERARMLFSGDTLFAGSVGRTDLPGGDFDTLARSIRDRIFTLGDDVTLFPGHGPAGTLGAERLANPFVGESPARGRFL